MTALLTAFTCTVGNITGTCHKSITTGAEDEEEHKYFPKSRAVTA